MVTELAGVFKAFLEVQKVREEWVEQEAARRDHRWRAMQHQFQQLQSEVGQSSGSLAQADEGDDSHHLTSARVSRREQTVA